MEIHTKLRRPSKDPSVLADQLLRELENLEREGGSAEEPELYRAYLDYAQTLAWEGVARGDLGAPRRILDPILAVQPLVATYEPAGGRPVERAALEVGGLIRSLYTACEAVADKQVEVRLADRRSATEREVLRVLAASQDEYLRRVDVYERLDPKKRPTPARVGQILAELHHDELLKRIHGRAQGNPNASFYALSPRGIEVCRSLGIKVTVSDPVQDGPKIEEPSSALIQEAFPQIDSHDRTTDLPPLFNQAVSSLVDPNIPWEWRRVLAGLLANIHYEGSIDLLRSQLFQWFGSLKPDLKTEMLIRTIVATWSYRLSPLASAALASPAEEELLSTLIQTIQDMLHPHGLNVFKLTNRNAFEPLRGSTKPSEGLRQTVQKAARKKQSLFHDAGDDLFEWALFNGQKVGLALEIEGSVEPSLDIVKDIQAAYFVACSMQSVKRS